MLTFSSNGKQYRITRAAMGGKNSAACAHTTTKLLVLLAMKRANLTTEDINYDIIIDDVAFLARQRTALEKMALTFDEVCQEMGVQLGSSSPIARDAIHRGINWNLKDKTKMLKQSFIDKMADRIRQYESKPTIARAVSLAGMTCYAGRIIEINVPTVLAATMKFQLTNDPTMKTFSELKETIMKNNPTSLTHCSDTPYGGTLFTDATPTRWATIFVNTKGDVETASGEFSEVQPIQLAEAIASWIGMEKITPFDIPHTVDVVTDNSGWLYTMHNFWSNNPALQQIKIRFARAATEKNIFPIPKHIDTELNPADEPSREEMIDLSKLWDSLKFTITISQFTEKHHSKHEMHERGWVPEAETAQVTTSHRK
jgi:hypothetical protein